MTVSDVFDDLLDPARQDTFQFRYGRANTIDGEDPLCGELIAWRHPAFGNYTAGELAYSFVTAHDAHYSRELFSHFECLAWLLSGAADWLPQRLRDILLEGMRTSTNGWSTDIMRSDSPFADVLYRMRSKFRLTRKIRSDLVELFASAVQRLGIPETPVEIADRFIAQEVIKAFYDEKDERRSAMRARAR